jgi:hypothetical protein
MLEDMVMNEVTSFLNEVDSFLSESRSFLSAPTAPELDAAPEEIDVSEESNPEVPISSPPEIETEEEDPATVLA